jgi:protein translocase, SecG subunit
MNPTLELILTILLVVIGVVMTVMILMQNSKSEGLSASLSGAAETSSARTRPQRGSQAPAGHSVSGHRVFPDPSDSADFLISDQTRQAVPWGGLSCSCH